VRIRPERPGDEAEIGATTGAAFAGKTYSDQTEPQMIERLRRAGALTISLVAEEDGRVVGHVAFSPVTLSGGEAGWYGLGPISVRPDRQKQGIGSALIHEGMERLRALGAQGCVLVGDPGYYNRFGFAAADPALKVADVPPEYFLVLPLQGSVPSGIVAFHPGFYGNAT